MNYKKRAAKLIGKQKRFFPFGRHFTVKILSFQSVITAKLSNSLPNLQILIRENLPFSAVIWLLKEKNFLSIPFNFAGRLY